MVIIRPVGPQLLPDARGTVYLPLVMAPPEPVLSTEDLEDEFYRLMMADPRQRRSTLTVCPCLVAAARARALGLMLGGPWAHVDALGVTPHEYARHYGCKLPASYPVKGNYIEDCAAGSADMLVLLNALAGSPAHADLLWGLQPTFLEQDKCGIGVAIGGKYGWYLVLMTAVCEP